MRSIAKQLKTKIEIIAKDLLKSNIFFHQASQGNINKVQVIYYMENVSYLLQYTPIHLQMAVVESMNDEILLQYFTKKIQEEAGHDQWAFNDLITLRGSSEFNPKILISSPMRAIVKNSQSIIQSEVKNYIIYIAFVEYLTVCYGPTLTSYLQRCGIKLETEFSAVNNHVTLDQIHADEIFQVVEEVFQDSTKWPFLSKMIDQYFQHLCNFYTEVALYRKTK